MIAKELRGTIKRLERENEQLQKRIKELEEENEHLRAFTEDRINEYIAEPDHVDVIREVLMHGTMLEYNKEK